VTYVEQRQRRRPAGNQHRRRAGHRHHLGQRQPGCGRAQRVEDLSFVPDPPGGWLGPGELDDEPAVDDSAGCAPLRIVGRFKSSRHDGGVGQVRRHLAQRGAHRVQGRLVQPGQVHPVSMTGPAVPVLTSFVPSAFRQPPPIGLTAAGSQNQGCLLDRRGSEAESRSRLGGPREPGYRCGNRAFAGRPPAPWATRPGAARRAGLGEESGPAAAPR
jgi:hypothetical protein